MRAGILPIIIWSILFSGCQKTLDTGVKKLNTGHQTENLIILVVDGPRFAETWGDPDKKYTPWLADSLAPQGIYNEDFYNFGRTKTVPGHTAISTGFYKDLDNNGFQYPPYPSLLQYYLKAYNKPPEKAWFITAKEKLDVLANTSHTAWRGKYKARFDSKDRGDIETYNRVIEVLETHQPNIMMINLRWPDLYGHAGDWEAYLKGIRQSDSLSWELYKYLERTPHYKDKTTLVITNDHGRHHDEIANGFRSHGDQCSGCTHINFFATGPDFKKDVVINTTREQIDIMPTMAYLLGMKPEEASGEVMYELFENER